MSLLKNIKSNRIAELKEAKSKLVSELNSLQIEYQRQEYILSDKNSDSRQNGFGAIAGVVGFIIGVMLWKFGTGRKIYMDESFFLSFLQAFGPLIGTILIIAALVGGVQYLFNLIGSSSDASSASNKLNNIKSKQDKLKELIRNLDNKIREFENS